MDIIKNNPFRIIGILVGTSTKEEYTKTKKLKMYIEAEQVVPEDFSFPIIGSLNRNSDNIEEAISKLNLNNDRVNASLFWFYNGNAITDEPAFDFLIDGNIDDAKSIWLKLIATTNVNERNSSAFHNLSTLLLHDAFEDNKINDKLLEQAIFLKIQFLESEFVKNFVSSATDITYKTTNNELQILFLNQLQTEIEKSKIFSTVDFLKILNNLSFSAKEDFFKFFVQKPIGEIEKIITETKTKRKADKTKSIEYGNNLYNSTQEDLEQLKSIIGKTNVKFISISDKVADEILQCGIENFNFYNDSDENKAKETLDLFQKAETFANGNITKQRCQENKENLLEWVNSSVERNELIRLQKYCWYCNKNIGEDEFKYETDIYKVISRGGIIQKEVNYQKSKIKVNRCGECYKIHGKGAVIIGIIFLISFISSFILFYLKIIKPHSEWFFPTLGGLFTSFLFSGIIVWILSFIVQNINANKYKIKTEDDIQKLIFKTHGSGWTTSKPSAK